MLGSLQRKIQIYKGMCKILHIIFGMGCLWILEKESRLWRNGEPQVIFEDETLLVLLGAPGYFKHSWVVSAWL